MHSLHLGSILESHQQYFRNLTFCFLSTKLTPELHLVTPSAPANYTSTEPSSSHRLQYLGPAGFFNLLATCVMAKSKSSMDSLPPQDIMDIIASVVLFPKPSNVLNPKRNSIEYFIHITERITKSSYHGIVGGCVFCGHNRKWTAAQIRIHFTKEKEGATHVHECSIRL